MDSILNHIIDIEKEAQAIVESANAQKARLEGEVEAEKRNIQRRLDEKIQKAKAEKLDAVQREEEEQAKRIAAQTEEKLAALREEFSKNGDAWQKQVFDSIIR